MTIQEKREKVINGLQQCLGRDDIIQCNVAACPYHNLERDCHSVLLGSTLYLLQTQEPCDDAVSRDYLLDFSHLTEPATWDNPFGGVSVVESEVIEHAPSVYLKPEAPRVMTLEEVYRSDYVYIQNGDNDPVCRLFHFVDDTYVWFTDRRGNSNSFTKAGYMNHWRCWTARPTKRQMEEIPWEETPWEKW